jgi:hypothetical protein
VRQPADLDAAVTPAPATLRPDHEFARALVGAGTTHHACWVPCRWDGWSWAAIGRAGVLVDEAWGDDHTGASR